MLFNGRYLNAKVSGCVVPPPFGFAFESWHAGDPGTDNHYYYAGPLSGGDYTVWNRPQVWCPAGAGYQPQANAMMRDMNVKKTTKGIRMLAVCPTMMQSPWGSPGVLMIEPHGKNEWISHWNGAAAVASNAYARNGLFNDGHVEQHFRKSTIVYTMPGGSNFVPTLWMEGNYSSASPIYIPN